MHTAPIYLRFAAGYDCGHSQQSKQMLPGRSMSRLLAILCAMMLVLSFGTGTTAHAEQRFDCMPVTSQSTAHFDGDRDESPSKNERGVAHHHSGCGGHHLGSPSAVDEPALASSNSAPMLASVSSFDPGRGPDSQLRPPIA